MIVLDSWVTWAGLAAAVAVITACTLLTPWAGEWAGRQHRPPAVALLGGVAGAMWRGARWATVWLAAFFTMLATVVRWLPWLLRRRKHLAATERAVRPAFRMPVGHPERITAELNGADEEWLASVCSDLWPADEWARIVHAYRNGEETR